MKKFIIAALFVLLTGTAFAYDYVDAIRQISPDGKGADDSIMFYKYLQDVLTIGDADNEAEAFFREFAGSVSNFSFKSLYKNKYFSDWPNGYRGVSFRADFIPGKYDYRMIPHDESLKNRSELSGIGAFISEFALRKNENSPICGDSFSLLFEGDATSAGLSHENTLRLIDNLLRISDPENLDLLKKKNKVPEGHIFNVLEQYSKDFPKFSSLDGIVDLDYRPVIFSHKGARYNYFELDVGFDRKRLGELFPNLAKYVKKQKQTGRVDVTVKNTKGHVFADIYVDLENQITRISHCTRDGLIVPYNIRGKKVLPYWDEAFNFASLETHTWDAHVEVNNVYKGIRYSLKNVVVRGQYDYDKEQMDFSLTLSSLPQSRISGAVYGIIPIGLIDIFIPGTIQSLADEFGQVMYKANYGAGSFYSLDWHKLNPSFWWLHWRSETEMVDSYLVRMGARLISRRYTMDEKTQSEAHKFATIAVQYLIDDLEAMKN